MNLTFLPSVTPPDYPGLIRAIVEDGVKIVETAGNNPQKWLPALKERRHQGDPQSAPPVRHSLKAESIGCDAVSVDGFECGGHPGEDDVAELHPAAARRRGAPDPVRGLGRHGRNGRSWSPRSRWAPDGMNMGTRFMATKEAPIHEHVKQAIGGRQRARYAAGHAAAAQLPSAC